MPKKSIPLENYPQIAERLKAARKACGFTLADVGANLGVTGGLIGAWEQGRLEPPTAAFLRLAAHYNVKFDWIIWGREPYSEQEGQPQLGHRLREAIERAGISQKLLAQELGVREATISRYVRRGGLPDPEILARIAERLSVTTDYLLRGSVIESRPPGHSLAVLPASDQLESEPATMGKGVETQEGTLLDQVLSELEEEKRASAARLAQLRACYQERQRLDAEARRLDNELTLAQSASLDQHARELASEAWRKLGLDGPFDLSRLLEVVVAGMSLKDADKPSGTIHEPEVGPARPRPEKG
ncbi:MAG: helix-turn-helix domain-containing protein [Pseudomonadota bacterium]